MSNTRSDNLTWRHWVLALAVALAFTTVLVRLYRVQVVDHLVYMEQAAVTRQGAVTLPATRGAVLDATGYPLATSIDTWNVYIDRLLWREHERAGAAAVGLAAFFDLDAQDLLRDGTEEDTGDLLLRRDLPYEEGVRLREQDLWGVRLAPSAVRLYPEGDLAGQLIGYVGRDGGGLWGVEADFDHVLSGSDGWLTTERDALGRPISFGDRLERPATPGGEVQLTVDRFIQAIVEDALGEALERYDAQSGSIIVMDPQTGAVLAMASRPTVGLSSVDLNEPGLGDLVRNRAITDLYEPGSTMKTLTTAMALDRGLVTPETTYDDTGAVSVGSYTIRNWDFSARGITTMREFLQHSLNTGAVWLADQIGPQDFYDYVKAFGLGEPTHAGLAGEAEGAVRTPSDPDWYPVDLATNSYGQGLAVTPLQMLTAINSLANEGELMRPYVVSRVTTEDAVRTFEPVQVRQVVRPETANTVLEMMHDVVDGMDHHGAQVPGYQVAGKTGTTLVSIPTGYDLDSTIASFAGFIPYEDPRVSVLVKIDQPSGGLNLGGQVAAPIFADVAEEIMAYLRVPPTAPQNSDPLVAQP
ncbi:MAG: penicillin-binding protein 2 [Dehalococcoidia bacterium]